MSNEKSPPVFNPLEKVHLAESVVQALMDQQVHPLEITEPFEGAGIYAIYYRGDYPAYKSIRVLGVPDEDATPIYVGKAIPTGGRRGGKGFDRPHGSPLHKRLGDHAASLSQVDNLKIGDFACRYLVVDEVWISLAESLLITRYQPIWNVAVDGFGNHDPGQNRSNTRRSHWDTLHPGRAFALRNTSPSKVTEREILEKIGKHFSAHDS